MSRLPRETDARKSQADWPAPSGRRVDLEPIRTAIHGIQFGEVRVVIQDGIVIQIDRVEKRRIR
jgi:hypothetical protein